MEKKRVLIVDDSAFMRKVISDIVNSDPGLQVADTAKNGQEAIQKVLLLKPDVMTLDVEMPVMDGLSALEVVMRDAPMPVIMLSSLTKEGADATLKALELGALDFITKPSSIFQINTQDMQLELLNKLKMASRVSVKARTSARRDKIPIIRTPLSRVEPPVGTKDSRIRKIIAIGTSTGGPKALQDVIPLLPANLQASVLVVQHMPPGFTKSLAERMDGISQMRVKEAEHNDVLLPGWVYIAPGDYHLRVVRDGHHYRIKLGDDGLVSGHRPSVDAMMESLAELKMNEIVGVIMTGMGSDGAKGLKRLKENRTFVIAQDEESCVVFGMPKSAIKLEAVDKIVSLDHIADEIIKAMGV